MGSFERNITEKFLNSLRKKGLENIILRKMPEGELLPGNRMIKGQLTGAQSHASTVDLLTQLSGGGDAVPAVAQKRQACARHLNPDLMMAAREQEDFHQRDFPLLW